jgi:hypothetical protein
VETTLLTSMSMGLMAMAIPILLVAAVAAAGRRTLQAEAAETMNPIPRTMTSTTSGIAGRTRIATIPATRKTGTIRERREIPGTLETPAEVEGTRAADGHPKLTADPRFSAVSFPDRDWPRLRRGQRNRGRKAVG